MIKEIHDLIMTSCGDLYKDDSEKKIEGVTKVAVELAPKLWEDYYSKIDWVFDVKGHNLHGETLKDVIANDRYWVSEESMISKIESMISLYYLNISSLLKHREIDPANHELKDEYYEKIYTTLLSYSIRIEMVVNCGYCGEYTRGTMFNFLTNKIELIVSDSDNAVGECTYERDNAVSVELKFPSGKMVFANDLRHDDIEDKYIDINSAQGRNDNTLHHAKHNIGYFQVGNSCPSIFKANDSIKVVSGYYKEDEEDYNTEEEHEYFKEYEKVGSIGTDLWATCVMDLDEYNRAFGELGSHSKYDDITVVDVPKDSTFKFSSHYDVAHKDSSTILVDINKV